MAKLDYMLSIVWLLRSRRRMTAEQLAEALEISVRTVYRHIEALNLSGVPIISLSGPGGGYELSGTFESTPLFFDMTELKAMAHGAMLARQTGYPYAESLNTALEKIEHRLNERQIKQLERHAEDVSSVPSMLPSNEVRVFRVDRIGSLRRSEGKFTRPDNFSPGDFVRQWLAPQAKAQGESVDVRLQAAEDILDAICNQWFLQLCPAERNEGEARLRVNQEQMLAYMPFLLLSYGKSVTVLEPLILRQKLAEQARQLAAFYESTANS